ISNLAIAEPYRRQGVATALLVECERFAKRWGFTAIYLHVLEDNQAARRLYQGVGYRTESILADWFSRLLGRSRRLLMRKTLSVHR
ncbi:MAG: GNAT family N-acetyltransferase, partial [Cyanobacteria bacterium P01_F01_bin.153]